MHLTWTTAAFLLSCLAAPALAPAPAEAKAPAAPRAITPRGPLSADELRIIKIFEETSPSVVSITTSEKVLRRGLRSYNAVEIPRGTGTGFVWDTTGHVVTNFHVIAGGDRVTITFNDHKTVPAKVVGAAPDKDIAVLKVDPAELDLRAIAIGRSGDLRVGQRVLAIGNPFGLDQSLTTGVVSALDRTITASNRRTIQGVIQTDAAINPGNSGGPLLDSAGRLIGVNTAIQSPSGANAGIGFAVPVDTVNRVVPQLINFGQTRRPTLGIEANDRIPRRMFKLPGGVLVVGVMPGSGAAAAGLRPARRDGRGSIHGDIIIAVNGQGTATLDDLLNTLEKHEPGETVTVDVLRDGRRVQIPIRLNAAR